MNWKNRGYLSSVALQKNPLATERWKEIAQQYAVIEKMMCHDSRQLKGYDKNEPWDLKTPGNCNDHQNRQRL